MADWLVLEDPAVMSAMLSAIAALAAAIATWRAPLSAAKIAERLRRQGDGELEARRFRLNVFATLMQGRAEIHSEETVRALNSIDVAFSDELDVREAWAELYQALCNSPINHQFIDERFRKLLKEMAQNLGMSKNLRLDDFARNYFPNSMMEDREMRTLQRQQILKQFANISNHNEVEDSDILRYWPPKPN